MYLKVVGFEKQLGGRKSKKKCKMLKLINLFKLKGA